MAHTDMGTHTRTHCKRRGCTSLLSHKRHLSCCLGRTLKVLLCQPGPVAQDLQSLCMLYVWWCSLKEKKVCVCVGGGVHLMAFWSHGVSRCHPLTLPPGPLSLPSLPCPLPGRMQCQEGEHWAPIVCANQSGMPGWQKGEEWAQGTQSQGEERVGGGAVKGRRGGGGGGAICWGLNRPSQPPKLWAP